MTEGNAAKCLFYSKKKTRVFTGAGLLNRIDDYNCFLFLRRSASRLLQGAVFSSLDHILVGGDVDLHTAVLGTAFGCRVGGDIVLHGEAFG